MAKKEIEEKETKIDEPVPEGKFTAQEFATAYQDLVTKTKFRIVAIPSFLARDDGTFSVVIQYQIAPSS